MLPHHSSSTRLPIHPFTHPVPVFLLCCKPSGRNTCLVSRTCSDPSFPWTNYEAFRLQEVQRVAQIKWESKDLIFRGHAKNCMRYHDILFPVLFPTQQLVSEQWFPSLGGDGRTDNRVQCPKGAGQCRESIGTSARGGTGCVPALTQPFLPV